MSSQRKRSGHRVAMTVLASIVLTVLLISLVNLGLSIFVDAPEYTNYCGEYKTQEIIDTASRCEEIGGKWNADGVTYPAIDGKPVTGYCDRDYSCRMEYESAQKAYNQIRYYVFALLGLALLFTGLFSAMNTVQYSGMASGTILLIQGIVTNLNNKVLTFVSLLLILVLFGYVVYRKIEK